MSDREDWTGESSDADREDSLDGLVSRLESEPSSPERFGRWWIRSARAAVLGHPGPFDRWPAIAASLGVPPAVVLEDVCRTTLVRLEAADGLDGDRGIIDAEDLSCLHGIEPHRTNLVSWSGMVIELVRLVRDGAARRVPGEDGVEMIRTHARAFPVPSPHRIPAVAEPLSPVDLAVGAGPLAPVRHVAAQMAVDSVEVAMFDGGRPSARMIERFANRRGEAVTPEGRLLLAEPVLDAWWGVRLRVEGEGAEAVLAARLGSRALERLPVEAGGVAHFETSLAGLTPDVQSRLIGSEIMLRTNDGGRFTM